MHYKVTKYARLARLASQEGCSTTAVKNPPAWDHNNQQMVNFVQALQMNMVLTMTWTLCVSGCGKSCSLCWFMIWRVKMIKRWVRKGLSVPCLLNASWREKIDRLLWMQTFKEHRTRKWKAIWNIFGQKGSAGKHEEKGIFGKTWAWRKPPSMRQSMMRSRVSWSSNDVCLFCWFSCLLF